MKFKKLDSFITFSNQTHFWGDGVQILNGGAYYCTSGGIGNYPGEDAIELRESHYGDSNCINDRSNTIVQGFACQYGNQ